MREAKKRVAVVLFQLGGPDSLETVQPFLYNLFCDPDILDLPLGGLFRKPLAWYIAKKRWEHAALGYKATGNHSPILPLTQRQARALEDALRPYVEPQVVIAMRYWHPLTDAAAREVQEAAPEEIVLLPLYPQFSFTTTGSSLNEWDRVFRGNGRPVHVVRQYHTHPLLVESFVERIVRSLGHFRRPPHRESADVHLVFSAHSVPLSFIERGDPYRRQVEETVKLVVERGRQSAPKGHWPAGHTLCYQSKVGRQRWLSPSLTETIPKLVAAGVKRTLVVPIAFVSEHVETLHEINQEGRELASQCGIEQFEMMPALGDAPVFIAALATQVLEATGLTQEARAMEKRFARTP